MSNSEFEKSKVALLEKQLKERANLINLQNDAKEAYGKDNLPPEVTSRHDKEINQLNEKHAKETKAFFEEHTGIKKEDPKEEKSDFSKSKDKEKDKDFDKED